jgi:hypothetical protein
VYRGNSFSGSGWISEKPFVDIVRVEREDLRTDNDAFGRAIDDIYGGRCPSRFEAEIRGAARSNVSEEKSNAHA